MKIYTKTGDTGTTSLVGGSRIGKGEVKIEAYGTIDELNAWIGVLGDLPENEQRKEKLKEIQDRLFTIGAELASEVELRKKAIPDLNDSDISILETWMDEMEKDIPPLRAFVLPGGHLAVSYAHVARTVCRRAERQIIRLKKFEEVHPLIIPYVNRLSDFLFMLSRKITQETGSEEIAWKPRIKN
ncbi:MAG: cob(I)yrinic acid a,c-diamide adenosyltransferase [Spirosomataceae bacterium]